MLSILAYNHFLGGEFLGFVRQKAQLPVLINIIHSNCKYFHECKYWQLALHHGDLYSELVYMTTDVRECQ